MKPNVRTLTSKFLLISCAHPIFVFLSGQSTSKSAARRKCLFTIICCLDSNLTVSKGPFLDMITIFHISFAVTPSNAQPHTRPPMRINVPHHTSELHYFILLICCSHRSNSRTVCEEAKPTYHSYGTPKCHQEPKQDCKQVFFS